MTQHRDRSIGSPRIPLTTRWGVGLAVVAAVLSGFSIFVNGFAVKQLPDPAVYTTLKNGVAALGLLGVALLVVCRSEVCALDRRSWAGMALIGVIGVIGGSIPFLLFFSGLAAASAPTAAFIQSLANGVVPAPPVLAGQALITMAVVVAAAFAVRAARREAPVTS